jgi:hypothetical protein
VHEAGTRHRLDRRQHRLPPVALEAASELRERVIRRARALADQLTVGTERPPVQALATEIQSDVQHRGASFR